MAATISNNAARVRVNLGESSLLQPALATLISPSAIATELILEPEGPTTLATELRLHEFGEYTLVLNNGLSGNRHQFMHRQMRRARHNEPPSANRQIAAGLLHLWTPDALQQHDSGRWRNRVTVIALLLFLASLVVAANPDRAIARRFFGT